MVTVFALFVSGAIGASGFHDFLDDDDVQANQELLGEFGNIQVSFL